MWNTQNEHRTKVHHNFGIYKMYFSTTTTGIHFFTYHSPDSEDDHSMRDRPLVWQSKQPQTVAFPPIQETCILFYYL